MLGFSLLNENNDKKMDTGHSSIKDILSFRFDYFLAFTFLFVEQTFLNVLSVSKDHLIITLSVENIILSIHSKQN